MKTVEVLRCFGYLLKGNLFSAFIYPNERLACVKIQRLYISKTLFTPTKGPQKKNTLNEFIYIYIVSTRAFVYAHGSEKILITHIY